MGGKHSKSSDQGTPKALNIQGDEEDIQELSDGEAVSQAPAEDTPEEEPKNPLQVPELLENVVEHINADAKPRKYSKKQTLDAMANMLMPGNPSFFPEAINKPRMIEHLLLCTAWGDEDKVSRAFEIAPDHIEYLIGRSTVKDPGGRTFEKISAFQYALWADDWHMWEMMLTALDKAESEAIPEETRQKKPYLGQLSQERIGEIRAELSKQEKEVKDKGLDYSITRYDRVQDAAGKYQLINPRTVEVKGESHFDMKGPEFCLMPNPVPKPFIPEKGKMYVEIKDGALYYQVIALSGRAVKGSIALSRLAPLQQLDSIEQLNPYIHTILKITSEADHTHPQALISALATYVYGLDNHWNDAQLIEQWCGGVGMAQREATTVIAQETCREDVLLDLARGEFKEQIFPRTFKLYNWISSAFENWFCSGNRLGLDLEL